MPSSPAVARLVVVCCHLPIMCVRGWLVWMPPNCSINCLYGLWFMCVASTKLRQWWWLSDTAAPPKLRWFMAGGGHSLAASDMLPPCPLHGGVALGTSPAINKDVSDAVADEDNLEYGENGRWPFQQFVDQLIHDTFDPSFWCCAEIHASFFSMLNTEYLVANAAQARVGSSSWGPPWN